MTTPQAEADLDQIWTYSVQTWGVERADRYSDQLFAAFRKIAESRAAMHSCERFSENAPTDVRFHLVNRHLVFFRLPAEATPDTVDILALIHEESLHRIQDFLGELEDEERLGS